MATNIIKNTEKLTDSQVEWLLNLIGTFEEVQIAHEKQFIDDILYNQLCSTIATQLKPYANHPESKLLINNIGRKYPVLKFKIDS